VVTAQRGHTLIELCIYSGMLVLLLAVIGLGFQYANSGYQNTTASFLISKEASTGIQWLKADLQETALSTIRIGLYGPKKLPGLSMISSQDKDGAFSLSAYGTPAWNHHVFYCLSEDGKLCRWEEPFSKPDSADRFLPMPSAIPPFPKKGSTTRLVLRDVLQPYQEVSIDQKSAPFPKMDAQGGFKVGFVAYDSQLEEHPLTRNPAEVSLALANGISELEGVDIPLQDVRVARLVEVRLGLLQTGSNQSKPSAILLPFRVSPRH
jgi:hypothetical protein